MTQVRDVSPQDLKIWLDAGQAILIDVRDPHEYEEVRIPGSILIPIEGCGPAMLPQNPDKKIVFHCKKGGRAGRACHACVENAPHRVVYNLAGGIEAWAQAGLPIEQGIDAGRL